MIVIALFSWRTLNLSQDGIDWVTHTLDVKLRVAEVEKTLLNAETSQRGFLLTGRDQYLVPYKEAKAVYQGQLAALRDTVSDNPNQIERSDQLIELAEEKFAELQQTIDLAQSGRVEQAKALVMSDLGIQTMDQMRVVMSNFAKAEQALLEMRIAKMNHSIANAHQVSLWGTLMAIATGIFISIFIASRIITPIRSAASELSVSTQQMSAAAEEQERTIAQQASAVDQTTSIMEVLGKSARQSADHADLAKNNADKVLKLSGDGLLQVRQAQDVTNGLREKVDGITEQIRFLSGQANQIQDVTLLVSELAMQTNLLALNAAVEAAHAGDQGKGFAVVAAEIRKLADESKKSAGHIQSMLAKIHRAIKATVTVTEEGVKRVGEVAELSQQNATVLGNIASAAESATQSAEQIRLNAREQATAVRQVVDTMISLNAGARETAAGILQSTAIVKSVENSAQRLSAMV